MAEEARTSRRRRTARRLGWLTAGVTLLGGGWLLTGLVGVGAGAGVLALAAGGHQLVGVVAARRGAVAWDWRARRYRLIGNPSARVQRLDAHRDDPTDLGHLLGPDR